MYYRLSVDGYTVAGAKTIDGLFTDPDNEIWSNKNFPYPSWNQLRIYVRKNHKDKWHLVYTKIGGCHLCRKEWNPY